LNVKDFRQRAASSPHFSEGVGAVVAFRTGIINRVLVHVSVCWFVQIQRLNTHFVTLEKNRLPLVKIGAVSHIFRNFGAIILRTHV